jgi:hypothetical protein
MVNESELNNSDKSIEPDGSVLNKAQFLSNTEKCLDVADWGE